MQDRVFKINVHIAERKYTLNVDSSEEEIIRKAVKKIDDDLKMMEKQYGIRDKQDLLAMLALQTSNDILKYESNINGYDNLANKLEELDLILNDNLEN